MKKVLVVGATGAMGKYLIPELDMLGYNVVGLTLDDVTSDSKNVTFVKGNAMDKSFLESVKQKKDLPFGKSFSFIKLPEL